MKIIGYARVSSKEQAEGRSIENQIKVLKAAGCEDVLVDIESAYSKKDRPNFNKLMEMVRDGLVSKVIVCTLDRLSRNETVTFIAFDDFEKAGCQLISLEENFNLQSPEGRLQAGFAALMARNYSAQLSQKTRRGHKARRDRTAGYFKCFGYKITDERYQLDHDPFLCLLQDRSTMSRAAIAYDIINIFKQCKSLRRTLHNLNAKYGLSSFSSGKGKGNRSVRDRFGFSQSGLHSWLTNPILRGHTCYGRSQQQRQQHKHLWDIRYDTHPDDRLISDSEYRELDNIFDWNKDHHGFDNSLRIVHPLSGLVYCGDCGRSHRVMGSLQRDKVTLCDRPQSPQ
ncbi:MAG: recombinase family protein [Pseudanabaena sp.]